MKKLKKLLIIVGILCLLTPPISADDTNTSDVTYHVDSGYTWQIHTTIDFGSNAGINQTINRTAQIGQDNLGVMVTQNIIPDGASLKIDIDDSQTFVLTNGNSYLNYVVKKTSNGDAMTAGDNVLTVNAGTNTDSQALYFTLTTGSGTSEVAGTYSGIITYQAYIDVPSSGPQLNSIGGIIFYDDGSNGATYTFYDVDRNELNSYENAVYYSIEGTPSKDRYYVVATNNNNIVKAMDLEWGAFDTEIGNPDISNSPIGSGKTNTSNALANNASFIDSSNGTNTIWTWINNQNLANLNMHNDWFIGCSRELNALRTSGYADEIFNSYYNIVWCSNEYSPIDAYVWTGQYFDYYSKSFDSVVNEDSHYYVLAFRAF